MSIGPQTEHVVRAEEASEGGRHGDQHLATSELRYLVLAAQREGNRAYSRSLIDLGLTSSQAEIIVVLDEFGPLTLREVGEMIVCEAGSPSRIVDALVARSYVERTPDKTDRRAVTLSLTPAGRSLVPALRTIEAEFDALTAAQLTAEQRAVVAGVLRGFLTGSQTGMAIERRFGAKRSQA